MKKEDNELLLKDLCARLPYNTKIQLTEYLDFTGEKLPSKIKILDYLMLGKVQACCKGFRKDEVKPYLFPLSSMTEEQWNTAPTVNLTEFTFESLKCGCFTLASYTCENELYNLLEFINWLIENHFDIYGLIPKGLAIDATNLGIY